jgi:hypothetical protein
MLSQKFSSHCVRIEKMSCAPHRLELERPSSAKGVLPRCGQGVDNLEWYSPAQGGLLEAGVWKRDGEAPGMMRARDRRRMQQHPT